MAQGRVVKFDDTRGFGFIEPSDGGDDVFLHVNDLTFDKQRLSAGAVVEYEVEEGNRGPKAVDVRLGSGGGGGGRPASSGGYTSSPRPDRPARQAEEEDGLVDVLPEFAFSDEVTEALLEAAPTITGRDILAVRRRLIQLARDHGWVEG